MLALVLLAALSAVTGVDRAWVTAQLSATPGRRVAVHRAVLSTHPLGPSEPVENESREEESKAPVLKRVLAFLGFFAFWGSRSDSAQAEETFAAAAATAVAVDASGLMTGEALAGATVGALAGRAVVKDTAAPVEAPTAAAALADPPVAELLEEVAVVEVESPVVEDAAVRDLEEAVRHVEEASAPVPEAAEPAPVAEAVEPAAEEVEEMTPPTAPGMEDANLVVAVTTDPKTTPAASEQAGVELLMQQPSATILGLMARDGWQVNEIDVEAGVFEVLMPAVEYEMPLGTVSIVPPRFQCVVRDSAAKEGAYQERLVGDLVLENGDGLLSVELKMGGLFSRDFSISAAGWARCWLGGEGGDVRMKADVEIGLQVPKVPGLTQVMEYFVRTYANNSTKDCTVALAKGADHLHG